MLYQLSYASIPWALPQGQGANCLGSLRDVREGRTALEEYITMERVLRCLKTQLHRLWKWAQSTKSTCAWRGIMPRS